MSASTIIQELEKEQMRQDLPDFRSGDTVVVKIKVKEGAKERLQTFEGVVIGKRNRGLNSSFTVRRIAHGIGVERAFQTHSPIIESISVKRRGDVRKVKLYYLRDLTGRKARIREKIVIGGTGAIPASMPVAKTDEEIKPAIEDEKQEQELPE